MRDGAGRNGPAASGGGKGREGGCVGGCVWVGVGSCGLIQIYLCAQVCTHVCGWVSVGAGVGADVGMGGSACGCGCECG